MIKKLKEDHEFEFKIEEAEALKLKGDLAKTIDDLEIKNKILESKNSKIVQQTINTLYATLESLKAENKSQRHVQNMCDEDKVTLL